LEPNRADVLYDGEADRLRRFEGGRLVEPAGSASVFERLRWWTLVGSISSSTYVESGNLLTAEERRDMQWRALRTRNGHFCGLDRATQVTTVLNADGTPVSVHDLGVDVGELSAVYGGCLATTEEEERRTTFVPMTIEAPRELGVVFPVLFYSSYISHPGSAVGGADRLVLFGADGVRDVRFPAGGFGNGRVLGLPGSGPRYVIGDQRAWFLDDEDEPIQVPEIPVSPTFFEIASDGQTLVWRSALNEAGTVDYFAARGVEVRPLATDVEPEDISSDEWVTTHGFIAIRTHNREGSTRVLIRQLWDP
jgi:hypothetical protein